ncbi:hypothetical protein R3P38DRAFT_2491960 [Favolaschia claudopus]|uniref:Uncharacterized protein n=1 Tax=Favolaschia claudopus TaxID=2862362 RepID=A0AAW0ECG7_9AGAR
MHYLHSTSCWLGYLLVLPCLFAIGYAKYVPFLQQGFMFDYNVPAQPVPIPVTEQCETIHLKWGRRGATGPNPVAPYSMVVYTSTFVTPFTIATGNATALSFDWTVPFAPGTQYQICMWDKNGVPGGCQATYTVIQNSKVASPNCQNITFPALMEVDATVPTGPMSQFGWIDQCTDLFVTPKSGKPPFTLTVAPALHPPYNITVNSMTTIDWTVSLSWASPFFLSLASSDGQMWSYGPLHAGGGGPNGCLAPGSIPSSKAHSLAVGAGVGGAFGAAIVACLLCYLYIRFFARKTNQDHSHIEAYKWTGYNTEKSPSDQTTLSWTTGDDALSGNTNNQVSPGSQSQLVSPSGMSERTSPAPTLQANRRQPSHSSSVWTRPTRAYVLHHDAGQAPVTVITEAEEVVELPPDYRSEVVRGARDRSTMAATPGPAKSRIMNDSAQDEPEQTQPEEVEASTHTLTSV